MGFTDFLTDAGLGRESALSASFPPTGPVATVIRIRGTTPRKLFWLTEALQS